VRGEGIGSTSPCLTSDAALRVPMRLGSHKKPQKPLGTHRRLRHHDQVEAMTWPTRSCVNAGRIEQYGAPARNVRAARNLVVAASSAPQEKLVAGEAAGTPGAYPRRRPNTLKIGKQGEGWARTVSVARHLGREPSIVEAGKSDVTGAR